MVTIFNVRTQPILTLYSFAKGMERMDGSVRYSISTLDNIIDFRLIFLILYNYSFMNQLATKPIELDSNYKDKHIFDPMFIL